MSSGQNHSLFLQVAQWSQVWIFCIVNEEAEEEADDDDDEDKDEHEDDEDDDFMIHDRHKGYFVYTFYHY